jgi:hypothetical protein
MSVSSAGGVCTRADLERVLNESGIASPPDPSADILHISFRHELGNAGPDALQRRIGLWSIIQLPCEAPSVFHSFSKDAE